MATNLLCVPGMTGMTIGYPEANMHTYIVDAGMKVVPPGVPGELLLSGPRLAQGYIGRPDLTADKFIENPCYAAVEGGLPAGLRPYFRTAYRTGDLCRFRGDGQIDFMGRVDNQVKINGVRMELSEVEAALSTAPGVTMAVATAVIDPATNSKRLVGYVRSASATPEGVMAHCRTLLIPAMVPSVAVVMPDFPLLPNGKVDTKALPAPEFGLVGAYEAPKTPMEEKLQPIWTRALKLKEPLSATADFFAAGGTSLQVFTLMAEMQSELSLPQLPPMFIHSHRTIQAAAQALAGEQFAGPAQAAIAAKTWGGDTRPLSANQEQMWVLFKADPASCAYNMPLVLTTRGGAINAGTLGRALNAVAAQHEVLRWEPLPTGGRCWILPRVAES